MRPQPLDGVARLIVSPPQLHRSLLYLDAVIAEAERRSWTIEPSHRPRGTAIVVRGHAYRFSIHELHDRVAMTEDDLRRWRADNEWKLRWHPESVPPQRKSVPNGFLRLELESNYDGSRTSWSEGRRGPLERKLPQFFRELERRADEDGRKGEARSEANERRDEQLRDELGRRLLHEAEAARVEQLLEDVRMWRVAHDIRGYIAALRANEPSGPVHGRGLAERIAWAEAHADAMDPVANGRGIRGLNL